MCNRFIKEFADNIAICSNNCDCYNLKNSCKYDNDFQLTNRNIRKIFIDGEIHGIHGSQYIPLFKTIDFSPEFIDFAICYLHEGNVESFFKIVSHMTQFLFYNPKISDELKLLMRKKLKKHLSCINLNIFSNYVVHVGFGNYNERDGLQKIEDISCYRKDNRNDFKNQEYVFISLDLWLHVFIEEDNPRTYIHDMDIKGDDLLYKKFLNIENRERNIEKRDVERINGENFQEKLLGKIIENITCDCIYRKTYQYVPKNVRDLFKKFKPAIRLDNKNLIYRCVFIPIDRDVEPYPKIPELFDMALCYLEEKNYIDFFNIISEIGVNDDSNDSNNINEKITQYILRIPYSDIKNYRVNIDIENEIFQVFNVNQYSDKKTLKKVERYWETDFIQITDDERYNIPFSEYFMNITYDRWLSDMLTNIKPMNKWKKLWKNGLKYKWKNFP